MDPRMLLRPDHGVAPLGAGQGILRRERAWGAARPYRGSMATPIQVVIDCADPARLAAFWAAALGYQVQPPPEGFETWEDALRSWGVPKDAWNSRSAVVDPDGEGPRIFFQQVPEPKTVKNRVHLDVNAGGPRGTPDEEHRRRIV